jgi:hypothetical protein
MWKSLSAGFMAWVLLANPGISQAATINFSASIDDGTVLKSTTGANLSGQVKFGVFWNQNASQAGILNSAAVGNLWSSTSAPQRFATLQSSFLSLTTNTISVTNGSFAFSGTANNEYDTGVEDGQGGTFLVNLRNAAIFAFVTDNFSAPTGMAILTAAFATVGDENDFFQGATSWSLLFNSGSDEWGSYDPTVSTVVGTIGGSPNAVTSVQLESLPGSAATPTITGAVTAAAFTTTYGTASAAQTFPVSGANLTASLVATAPTGLEVSSDGTAYGSTATFAQAGGSASGTLHVRLAATAAVSGSYNSQNIVLSSTGATSVNVATPASGNSVSAKALTISGLTAANKDFDGTTTATVTGTPAYVGLVNGETFSVSGAVTWAFPDAAVGSGKTLTRTGDYAAPSANYSVTQPTLTASIRALPALRLLSIGTPVFTNGNTTITHTFSGNNSASYVFEFKSGLNNAWQTNAVSVGSSTNFSVTFTNFGVNSTNEWRNRMFFRVKNG